MGLWSVPVVATEGASSFGVSSPNTHLNTQQVPSLMMAGCDLKKRGKERQRKTPFALYKLWLPGDSIGSQGHPKVVLHLAFLYYTAANTANTRVPCSSLRTSMSLLLLHLLQFFLAKTSTKYHCDLQVFLAGLELFYCVSFVCC